MRPPQNAGENVDWVESLLSEVVASMRPPQNAGENNADRDKRLQVQGASMRPPQNAGENGALSDAATMRLPAWHCERFAAGMAARPRELRPVVHCGAY